ncbi:MULTISPECIES: hypothetical protein [Psychrilyobacter]|uniref:Uncharacterized protein n=1 Tax=Psychrilyobacter piezotolerans TaxID=2293438 RepID=A0ABX9KGV3_9FUSO|nr:MULTISPECIES: hypothetical protein [Psychrilyobacter]MCS5420361.1 hypothetical protein [Psychrilyobacter sp. S5]NDI78057.1 hypothetical protein [Psychrilyobacter piezotolerans]RDE61648.1 hypothetical protein DV867_08365 [Psychrilyobacter sp. S5]REI41040.1 hypothetical protein DYH56_08365 [Psychrilyobacter piezotolerans]
MIKRMVFLILVVFTFSFGQVTDSGNYLTAEEKQEIEKKLSEIEKNGDIVYHINLGRKMDEKNIVEKAIILDIIPDGKNDINVQLKFTQDIDTSDYEEEIDNLLVEGEDAVVKKEYKKFILSVLDVSEKIVDDIEVDKKEIQKQEVKKTFIENKFAGLLILIFMAIAIFVTLRFIKMGGIRKSK